MNATQNKGIKKIALAPKQKSTFFYVVIVLIALVGCLYLARTYWPQGNYKNVQIAGETFKLELSENQDELNKGLSGRNSIPANGGMIFDFGKNGNWSMWMKDMKFPLDIIWLEHDGTVTNIEKDANPASYPQTYQSPTDSWYVIELTSGTAQRLNLQVNDVVTIQP